MTIPNQTNPPASIQLEAANPRHCHKQCLIYVASKRTIIPRTRSKGGYVSQIFLVPKSDRSWQPVINLKSLSKVDCCSLLQDGIHQDSEGITEAGRPQGCLPISSNSQISLEILEISVGRKGASGSFRPFRSSSAVPPMSSPSDEASSSHSEARFTRVRKGVNPLCIRKHFIPLV